MLDHIALRVKDREATADYFKKLGFKVSERFSLPEIQAESIAMVGPHDLFISDGPGLEKWITDHGEGVHHIALSVKNIYDAQAQWMRVDIDFQSAILECPCKTPLRQVFTVEQHGLVYELIERNEHPGFCLENIKRLMGGTTL